MINGAHVIIYSKDAEADRSFFKDVLGFHHVDAGHGWLIFALPPAEVACHPGEANDQQSHLMCEDLNKPMVRSMPKAFIVQKFRSRPGCADSHHSPRWRETGPLSAQASNGRRFEIGSEPGGRSGL